MPATRDRLPTAASPNGEPAVLRELGVVERLHYVASQDYAVHFLVVAEFDVRLDETTVQSALAALVQRHPLLSAGVMSRPDGSLVFWATSGRTQPRVRVVDDPEATWEREAYRELHLPFDVQDGPLLRLILVRRDSHSALLLCLDHTIADGVSGVCLLNDLVAALNGRALAPLKLLPSAETLMAREFGHLEAEGRTTDGGDPRSTAPARSVRGDGATESLTAHAMTADDTAALARRCRTEHTTVHAAMVVAASRVRAGDTGLDFLRTASPISLRALVGVDDDCGMFISQAVTGLALDDGAQFWDQARGLTTQLDAVRRPAAIQAATAAMHEALDSAESTARLLAAFPFEVCVTNLGVKDVADTGSLRPTSIWGPVTQNVGDDCTIGIVTYDGRLRMTAYGLNVDPAFLQRVATTLVEAAQVGQPEEATP